MIVAFMNPLAALKKNGSTIMNASPSGTSTRDQCPPMIRGAVGNAPRDRRRATRSAEP